MKKEKIYSICGTLLLIDQLLKIIIDMKLKLNQRISIIPNFFSIYYVRNTGAAFSILKDQRYLFIGIAFITFFLLQRYISKTKITKKLEIISLGLLMGGLVGNLIDRLLYGYVIDYLSFNFFGYSFPIFNIADIGIVIGIILFSIHIMKTPKEH